MIEPDRIMRLGKYAGSSRWKVTHFPSGNHGPIRMFPGDCCTGDLIRLVENPPGSDYFAVKATGIDVLMWRRKQEKAYGRK